MSSNISEFKGINLSNYYRDPYSTNPVVYIHKRHLHENSIATKPLSNKQDEVPDFDSAQPNADYSIKIINKYTKDPVTEHTIKFAKDIIPLTIPPDTNVDDSIYYTIKSTKKAKRKIQELNKNVPKDVTFEKEIRRCSKCKHFKKDNSSGTEITNSCSQNNTMDDINDNRSLCFSLSETSERKMNKRERGHTPDKRCDVQKVVVSESLEAFATEVANTSNDNGIKIHLMNDKEKKELIDNISRPLVKAVQECFSCVSDNFGIKNQIQTVEATIEKNSRMLNSILHKISSLEKRLEDFENTQGLRNINPSSTKISSLEELGEDLLEEKDDLSSEEEIAHVNLIKKKKDSQVQIRHVGEHLAKGDKVSDTTRPSTSQVGVKTDTHKIPTRFCWTDAKV